MTEPIFRLYTFSDIELKRKADAAVLSMQRDVVAFNNRGITPLMTDDFEALSYNFGAMDTDEMWNTRVTAATHEKDLFAESLKSKIRTIRTMVAKKWGEKACKFLIYGFEELDGLSDDKLVRLGRRLVLITTDQQPDLASEGFSRSTLSALTANVEDFDRVIDTKNNAERNRDIAQQVRVETGNVLYTLLQKYSSLGKAIYANDPVKYNDYVIYAESPAKPAKRKKRIA